MNLLNNTTSKIPKELFTALDIGSSKVCCAIASMNRELGVDNANAVRVMGVASHIAKGIRGATIVNLEDLEDSILNAVHSAEQLSNRNIKSVYINIPADGLQSHYLTSTIALNGQAVADSHLEKALEDVGRKQGIASGRRIIHCFPMWYDLDDNFHIQDPKNMIGDNLITHFHIVTAPINLIANLSACVGRCHLDVDAFVAAPYATSLATLVEDEKEMGVTLLDIGSHNISIISYLRGMPIFLGSIPLGGNHITSDIAQGLNTSLSQAERLKTLYGSLIGSNDNKETILVTQLGEDELSFASPVSKSFLMHIINARAEEIIETIDKLLNSNGIDKLALQRFVITGGSSQLQGLKELIQQKFNKSVRAALPQGIQGMGDILHTPTFALCAGLLQYAMQDSQGAKLYGTLQKPKNFFKRMWQWAHKNI